MPFRKVQKVRTDRTSPPPYGPTFTSTFAWFMRVFMSGTLVKATATMEDPGSTAIGDLKLLVRDAGLLVAIAAIRANASKKC
jgi:hypothetical protein